MLCLGSDLLKGACTIIEVSAGACLWMQIAESARTSTMRLSLLECGFDHPSSKETPYTPPPRKDSTNFHSGGGCTKDADGNLILIKNQDEDNASVSSLMHSKVLRVPVGLILGMHWVT